MTGDMAEKSRDIQVWAPILVWSLPSLAVWAALVVAVVYQAPEPDAMVSDEVIAQQYQLAGMPFGKQPSVQHRDLPYIKHLQDLPMRDQPMTLRRTVELAERGEYIELSKLAGPLLDSVGLDGSVARGSPSLTGKRFSSKVAIDTLQSLIRTGNDAFRIDQRTEGLTVELDRVNAVQSTGSAQEAMLQQLSLFYKDVHQKVEAELGLHWRLADGQRVPFADRSNEGRPVVVLVHGAITAGNLWQALDQPLADAGVAVLEYRHRPLRSLRSQAFELARALTEIKQANIDEVIMVTHGYGCLMVRDVLTNEFDVDDLQRVWNWDEPIESEEEKIVIELPHVRGLAMIAPPNHGQKLAEMGRRVPGEARRELIERFSGNGLVFMADLAVSGSIRDQLSPTSDYLRELNRRSLPDGVASLIVAGTASPIGESDIALIRRIPAASLSEDVSQLLNGLAEALDEVVAGRGDGAVSLESAKLKGVPLVTLKANHITMLMSARANDWVSDDHDDADRQPPSIGAEPLPPAVPVIVRWVKQQFEAGTP